MPILRRPALPLALLLLIAPALALGDEPAGSPMPESPPKARLVDLTLKGSIPEAPTPEGLDGSPVRDNLASLVETLRKAGSDDEVQGLVLRVQGLSIGLGKANELRRAIEQFRASGKKAFAVIDQGGNAEYLVASAADEIIMPESGTLMLRGVAAEVLFYKNAFEKYGVKADMLQVGKYKAAAEPYTRSEMSPAFREELTDVLSDNYAILAEAVAARREIDLDEARALLEGGPYTPTEAKEKGLIDRVAYADEVEALAASELDHEKVELVEKYGKSSKKVDMSGLAGFMSLMRMLAGEDAKKPASKQPKIAVIHAAGTIQTGKSSAGGLLGDGVMGSESVIADLKTADEDETVKAIVLRVDSPGGSALASDLIWRETVRIKKPIVASMSDVAGSGGYYISVGCDRIFAEPGTLTGSIGVVGGKVSFGDLLEKVGLTTDTVTVGKNGLMDSLYRPFTDEERAAQQRLMGEVYRQFLDRTAKGRKLDVDRVEELAGGRVYSGRRARELGLVDELGTLDDAIQAARELAGLKPDDKTELRILPEPKGLLEDLLAPLENLGVATPSLGAPAALAAVLPEPARAALARAERMLRLLERERVLVVMPYEVQIR